MLNLISNEELSVLSEVQRLPLVSKPFTEIANRLGMDEDKIMAICKDLLSRGMIRRFGLSLNHRKVGFRANLMVAVKVPVDRIDEVGLSLAAEKRVTHCYHRIGWDYNLFFMIHSESKEEIIKRTHEILKKMNINDYRFMFSTRELKKISFEISKPFSKTEENTPNNEDRNKLLQIPMVLNISGPIIIFGGGKVALRKIEYISKFSKDITIIAKDSVKLPKYVTIHSVNLKSKDIPNYISDEVALVIAALSDSKLNAAVSKYCIEHEILVNVVDNPGLSTILFPALSKEGDLNVAISTGGNCPFLARKVREYWDSINSEWANWLKILSPIRKGLVGISEKNRVLSDIFENTEVTNYISVGDLEKAKKKAEDILNVYRKS